MLQHFLVPLLLLTLYSCSSSSLNVDYHIPMIRSFSAETLGEKGAFSVMGSGHSNHQVSVLRSSQSASVFSSTPSAVTIDRETQSSVSLGMGIQGAYALVERLDLFLAKNNEAPYEIGTQFQFLGEKGSVGKGFKASIWGSVGAQVDNEDESTLSLGDNSSKLDNVEAKTDIASRSFGLVVGHRLHEKLLIFTHFMHQFYEADSNLKINNGITVNKKQEAEQWAGSLGLRFNEAGLKGAFGQIEGGISRLRLSNGPKDSHKSVAFSAGASF
jgi:hypothetical protein